MVINRKIYLTEPKKWFGTKEEVELVNLCVETIKELKIPKYERKFIDDEKKVTMDNQKLIQANTWFIVLSKKVLEVYNGKFRKEFLKGSNKRS